MSPFQSVVIDESGPKVVADAFVPIRWIRRGLPRNSNIVVCGSDRRCLGRDEGIASSRCRARKQRNSDDTSEGPHSFPPTPLLPLRPASTPRFSGIYYALPTTRNDE